MISKIFSLVVLTMIGVLCMPIFAHANVHIRPPAEGAPFDGGLSLLIAAGVAYSSKKAFEKRKKDKLKADMEK